MKKNISLFLVVLMIVLACVPFTASAVSISEGRDAAQAKFYDGKSALDYVYYSPVKGSSDTTKYPLILWLHGNASGDYPRHQLDNSDIYKFSTDEFQARFVGAGGAFLLLPRDPTTGVVLAWDWSLDKTKTVLDDFIEEYGENIDLSRIYVGGNSMGGKGAFKMAATYPDVFAAVFPVSPVYVPSSEDMKALSDTAVWVFNNSNDGYPQLNNTIVKNYFADLNKASSNPKNNRWTSFSAYYTPGGGTDKNEIHNTWTAVLNDLFMDDCSEYKAMTTVDGEGNSVKLTYPEGFITWLSSQSLSDNASAVSTNFLRRILDMFVNFFNALLSVFGLRL
ncbi:MAG: hypothetical protein IKV21_00565 [Clostridia bacterium]|nr:hypothetical protein [Clostridia bacterium]